MSLMRSDSGAKGMDAPIDFKKMMGSMMGGGGRLNSGLNGIESSDSLSE